MKILSIETSCDETAVAIISGNSKSDNKNHSFRVLGDALFSQANLHAEYGGVYPSLAKREHAKNLTPLTIEALRQADLLIEEKHNVTDERKAELKVLLSREPELYDALIAFFKTYKKPEIDKIAVTEGPGLAPALWVGVNFAKALSIVWDVRVIPINHMEGHIIASIVKDDTSIQDVTFPALSLLISGGHTEIVLMRDWFDYELIGRTRDDAVGEAFDKVARMLELPYPGGPHISKLAERARKNRKENMVPSYTLPRPMIHEKGYDMSFSGLKTAVLYTLRDIENVTDEIKQDIALEFENAVTEILLKKTFNALDEYGAKSIIIGGGVSANKHIRKMFEERGREYGVELHIPDPKLSTDNAVMIGITALLHLIHKIPPRGVDSIMANGNLAIH